MNLYIVAFNYLVIKLVLWIFDACKVTLDELMWDLLLMSYLCIITFILTH